MTPIDIRCGGGEAAPAHDSSFVSVVLGRMVGNPQEFNMVVRLQRSLAVLAAFVLAGCTATHVPVDIPPSPSPYVLPATVEWSTDAQPIGSLSVGATEFVSYVRTATGLAMASYDLATGKELWRDPADPGRGAQGVSIAAPLVQIGGDSWTAYLAPLDGDWQTLKVVDARTGMPTGLTSDKVWATSRPVACANADGFCFTGYAWSDEVFGARPRRVDPSTGKLKVVVPTSGEITNVRFVGEHLYSTNDRSPGTELLGYLDGGVRWTRPYAEVFGPGFSSDAGWHWLDDSRRPVIVGSAADASTYTRAMAGETVVEDLTTSHAVVGLDPLSGRTQWKVSGATLCDWLGRMPRPVTATVVTICRFTRGTLTLAKNGETGALKGDFSPDLALEISGVEMSSGRVLWSMPLHRDTYNSRTKVPTLTASSDRTLVVMAQTGRRVLIDVATGNVTEPGNEYVIACQAGRADVVVQGREGTYWAGDYGFACQPDGTSSARWTVGAAQDVGESALDGALRIVAGEKGFVAVRVRER